MYRDATSAFFNCSSERNTLERKRFLPFPLTELKRRCASSEPLCPNALSVSPRVWPAERLSRVRKRWQCREGTHRVQERGQVAGTSLVPVGHRQWATGDPEGPPLHPHSRPLGRKLLEGQHAQDLTRSAPGPGAACELEPW